MESIVPQTTPKDKPHYVYTLSYPESMGGYVFYIGKGYGQRIDEHERRIKAGTKRKGDNPYKENVIKKIWDAGEEIVKEKIAYFAKHEEALELEVALIFLMRPYGHLTNLTDGGDGAWGYIPTEETRRYMSQVNKGRKRSEETRQRIREAQRVLRLDEEWVQRNREAVRKASQTEEWRQNQREAQKASEAGKANVAKMNAAKKGVPLSEEHRRKVGEAGKGRVFSEEHRRRLSEAAKGRKRAPFSEEWKRNMAEAHRGKKYKKRVNVNQSAFDF